jgi:hypothetical protein
MTIEELMQPRVKVKAHYPYSPFAVGDILTYVNVGLNPIYDHYGNGEEGMSIEEVDNSPAIFESIQWWERRDLKDMPEYVKLTNGKVFKVEKHFKYFDGYLFENNPNDCTYLDERGREMCVHYQFCLPTTPNI